MLTRLNTIARHPLATGIGVLTLLWLLFFWRILIASPDDRLIFEQDGDFILHFYAPIAYQIERAWDGDVPLWNPYNYGGEPSAANIQNGTFYPPRYLVALLAGRDNYTFYVYQLETALHYLLASLTMFGLLQVLFRNRWLAILGGVLFAYSGYMTAYPMLQASNVAAEAWFPLALLGIYLSTTRKNWAIGGIVLTAFCFALILLAGRPQSAFYLLGMSTLYLMFMGWSEGCGFIGTAWRVLLSGGAGVALAAVQLLPMAELTGLSYRVIVQGFAEKSNGFTYAELTRFFHQGFYGEWSVLYIGVAGLVLAIGAILRKERDEHTVFWLLIFAAALLLSLGENSIVYHFAYAFVPAFDLFRNQERVVTLVIFAAIMLALYQLKALFDEGDATHLKAISYVYTGIMAIVWIALVVAQLINPDLPDITEAINVFGFAVLIGVLFMLWLRYTLDGADMRIAAILLLVIVVVDLFSIQIDSINFEADIPENKIQLDASLESYSNIPADEVLWRVDGAAGLQGRGILFDVPDIYGLGAISLATPEQLYGLPVHKLWEIFSVRYVTATDPLPEESSAELLAYGRNYEGVEYQVLELTDPRPIAHLVYDYRFSEGSPDFARQIMADNRVDLREMGITLFPLPFELPVDRPEVSEIRDFTIHKPEHLSMTVDTGDNALLTLSIVNYPGWRAWVNDEPVDLVDNYSGLIGIPLEAGTDQQITLRFISDSVNQGAMISIGTLIGLCVLLGFNIRYHLQNND